MRRIDKYGTGREEEKCKFYYIDLRIQGRCKLTGKKCNSICEQFIERKVKTRLKLEKETLRYWQEKAVEAEQKMMAAKSKQTVKKWSRLLQVCGMNIRELERNIKNLKGGNKVKKVLGYSGTTWNRYGKGTDRIDVRIIGKVTQKHFIETVAAELNDSKNWIKERICETGNAKEIEIANSEVGTIFILKVSGFSVNYNKILRRLK